MSRCQTSEICDTCQSTCIPMGSRLHMFLHTCSTPMVTHLSMHISAQISVHMSMHMSMQTRTHTGVQSSRARRPLSESQFSDPGPHARPELHDRGGQVHARTLARENMFRVYTHASAHMSTHTCVYAQIYTNPICTHAYTHVYTHGCMSTHYTHVYTLHTCLHTCLHACLHTTHMSTRISARMSARMSAHMSAHMMFALGVDGRKQHPRGSDRRRAIRRHRSQYSLGYHRRPWFVTLPTLVSRHKIVLRSAFNSILEGRS